MILNTLLEALTICGIMGLCAIPAGIMILIKKRGK